MHAELRGEVHGYEFGGLEAFGDIERGAVRERIFSVASPRRKLLDWENIATLRHRHSHGGEASSGFMSGSRSIVGRHPSLSHLR